MIPTGSSTPTKKKPRTFTHADRQRLERAAELYLEECYRRKRRVRGKEFAATLGMTPEYASWLATRVLGRPLLDWFRGRQVEQAARLLQRTPLSVREIAALSGFGTRSTLYRAFVKAKGVTPTDFRGLKK
jgi:AraC-like DNA-binding protein